MSEFEVELSDPLRAELLRAPDEIRSAWWTVEDQLRREGAPRSRWHGQLDLPLDGPFPDHPLTRPFGLDGSVIFVVKSEERRVEVRKINWPSTP